MATIRELVTGARRTLTAAGLASPGREAALLLGSLLELSEAQSAYLRALSRGRETVGSAPAVLPVPMRLIAPFS